MSRFSVKESDFIFYSQHRFIISAVTCKTIHSVICEEEHFVFVCFLLSQVFSLLAFFFFFFAWVRFCGKSVHCLGLKMKY